MGLKIEQKSSNFMHITLFKTCFYKFLSITETFRKNNHFNIKGDLNYTTIIIFLIGDNWSG